MRNPLGVTEGHGWGTMPRSRPTGRPPNDGTPPGDRSSPLPKPGNAHEVHRRPPRLRTTTTLVVVRCALMLHGEALGSDLKPFIMRMAMAASLELL